MQDGSIVLRTDPARGPDDLTGLDRLAAADRDRREKRVRRAQVARVRDHHVQGARDRARERHRAGTGGPHAGACGRAQIGADMAPAELRARRIERPHHRPADRPDPGTTSVGARRRGRCGPEDDNECAERDNRTTFHGTSLERDEHNSGKAKGRRLNLPRLTDSVEGRGEERRAGRRYEVDPRCRAAARRRILT